MREYLRILSGIHKIIFDGKNSKCEFANKYPENTCYSQYINRMLTTCF